MPLRYGDYGWFFIGTDDEALGVYWAYSDWHKPIPMYDDFLDWLDTVSLKFFFEADDGWVVWQFADDTGPFYLKMFYHDHMLAPYYDFPWELRYHHDRPEDGDPWDHDSDHGHHQGRSNMFSPMTCPTSRPRHKGKPSKWDL